MKMKLILACCITTFFFACSGYCTTIYNVTTDFGTPNNNLDSTGTSDNSAKLTAILIGTSPLLNSGDVLYFPAGTYKFSTTVIDNKGLYFRGQSKESVTLQKYNSVSGAVIAVAQGSNTSSGGMSNLTFLGENNQNGNCGVMFGTAATDTPYIASKFTVENCDFKSFAEYGVLIYAASDFTINNVRILNHGDTFYSHNCIGFCIYPKVQTNNNANARLNNIYSEINSLSVCNSAAIKLQVMQNVVANNIYAKGGTEECMVIDALKDSVLTNLTVEAVSSSPGLAIRTYDPTYFITGENIVLDGVVTLGTFSRAITIGCGDDTYVSCNNITLMNVVTDAISASNKGVAQNSKFVNIQCSTFRFDESTQNLGFRFTNNQFVNINVSSSAGYFTITGDSNLLDNIRVIGGYYIRTIGSTNNINNCYSENSKTYGLIIQGDNNTVTNCHVKNSSSYPLWINTSNHTRGSSFLYHSSAGILDNGTDNLYNLGSHNKLY